MMLEEKLTEGFSDCNIESYYYPDKYQHVLEELIGAMRECQRWSAVVETYEAIAHVRKMGSDMAREVKLRLNRNDAGCQQRNGE